MEVLLVAKLVTVLTLLSWLWPVLSVVAVTDFVSPEYEKGSDCLKLQFNMTMVQADCEAIQIYNGTGKLLYGRETSTPKEAAHPGGKCGDGNITAKADDKDAVYVCGYPNMCSEVCFLDIFCYLKDPGLDALSKRFNVSKYMCSASRGKGAKSSNDSCECTCIKTTCGPCTKDDSSELSMGLSFGALLFVSLALNVILLVNCARCNYSCGRFRRRLLRINSNE